jgi:hypothetical protein
MPLSCQYLSFYRWIQPPAAIVEQGIDAMLGYLRRIWGSATSLALDLSSTGATYFPPEVFEKRFSRLTEINLSNCDLQELPLDMTMFKNLRSELSSDPANCYVQTKDEQEPFASA